MNKKIILAVGLILICMSAFVVARACPDEDIGDWWSGCDCRNYDQCFQNDTLEYFCTGRSKEYRDCDSRAGKRGYWCDEDSDCYSGLVCEDFGVNGRFCSECEINEHINDGAPDYRYDIETSYNRPLDDKCFIEGMNCSCHFLSNTGSFMGYGRWDSDVNHGDPCWSNFECFEEMTCNVVHDGGRRVCFNQDNMDCVNDDDCRSGFYCSDNFCTALIGTTTTSLAATTTTLPYQATTTTLPFSGFDCDYLVNVSDLGGDGFELDGGNVVSDGSLFVHNTSDDASLFMDFDDFPIHHNVDDIRGYIYLYTKDVPANWDYGGNKYSVIPSFNLGAFTNLNKPSASVNSDKPILTPNIDFDAGEITFNIAASGSFAASKSGVSNNEWIRFGVDAALLKLLTQNDFDRYHRNDSVHFILDLAVSDANNHEFYSFDDDPNFAPRLCIYDVEYAPINISDCSTDDDCSVYEFCETGWSTASLCMDKRDPSDVDSLGYCFRNHECMSGICSTHGDNGHDDYPVYTGAPPYNLSNRGVCVNHPFKVEVSAQPSVLIHNISDGMDVNVFARPLFNDQDYSGDVDCFVYFDEYYINSTYGDLSIAWAGNVEEGFSMQTPHYMSESLSGSWTYKNHYPLQTILYAGAVEDTNFRYSVECRTDGDLVALGWDWVTIRDPSVTFIEVLTYPRTSLIVNDVFDFDLRFLDAGDVPIESGNCSINGVEMTPLTNLYTGEFTFDSTGWNWVNFTCDKAGYSNSSKNVRYFVSANHCSDYVRNYGETGVDCGGECPACDVANKTPDLGYCRDDVDCVSGWCNIPFNECQTPSCDDGVKNGLESQIDCGGICKSCSLCNYDNECAPDGSQYCDLNTLTCEDNNCTVDSDCRLLTFYYGDDNSEHTRVTYCDYDGFCRLDSYTGENSSKSALHYDYRPLSGVTVNRSGTIFSVFNCDDKDELGFKGSINQRAEMFYSFIDSSFSPSYDSALRNYPFGDVDSLEKTGFISQLCDADEHNVGGFDAGQDLMYGKLLFKAVGSDDTINQEVDVLVLRNNLENDLRVDRVSEAGLYNVSAFNRDVQVWAKAEFEQEWRNITSGHLAAVVYNASVDNENTWQPEYFWLKVNSSFNEEFIYRNKEALPLVIQWDYDKQWFKLHEDIQLHGWMLYPVLAGIFVFLAYMNYKSKRNEGFRGGL